MVSLETGFVVVMVLKAQSQGDIKLNLRDPMDVRRAFEMVRGRVAL